MYGARAMNELYFVQSLLSMVNHKYRGAVAEFEQVEVVVADELVLNINWLVINIVALFAKAGFPVRTSIYSRRKRWMLCFLGEKNGYHQRTNCSVSEPRNQDD